jgi:predicted dehydrogenase
MKRIGLVGISGFGAVHFDEILVLHGEGRLKFDSAVVINAEEEREKCEILKKEGVEIFSSFESFLKQREGKIDLCYIPTGIHLHSEMTLSAISAGMNVLVEKPLAATIQDARAMVEISSKKNKFAAVGFQMVYSRSARTFKEKIISGEIGRLKSVRFSACSPRDKRYYTRNNWAGKLRAGGKWILDSPFNNAVSHHFELMLFLCGEDFAGGAEIASIEAELYRANPIESPDTASIRAYTKSGVEILFITTHACENDYDATIEITGEKGTIKRDSKEIIVRAKEEVRIDVESDKIFRKQMHDALLRRLECPSEFICDANLCVPHTLCVNGAHESSDVVALPCDFIAKVEKNGSELSFIKGIEEIVCEAFAKGKLFSELGVSWAKKGKRIELASYTHFPSK